MSHLCDTCLSRSAICVSDFRSTRFYAVKTVSLVMGDNSYVSLVPYEDVRRKNLRDRGINAEGEGVRGLLSEHNMQIRQLRRDFTPNWDSVILMCRGL